MKYSYKLKTRTNSILTSFPIRKINTGVSDLTCKAIDVDLTLTASDIFLVFLL